MTPKILRRCDVCKRFHAEYRVVAPDQGIRYLCYECWKAQESDQTGSPPKTGEQPRAGEGQDVSRSHSH